MADKVLAAKVYEKERIAENRNKTFGFTSQHIRESFIEGAEWKESDVNWNERMHEIAIKQNLTNKEFRKMLEQYPDDALICVECCDPRGMIFDEKYNLIRID